MKIKNKEKFALVTFVLAVFITIVLLISVGYELTGYFSYDPEETSSSDVDVLSCTDSDGSNYGTRGVVTECVNGECSRSVDSCSGKAVNEFYCIDETKFSKEYECEFDCDSGVCLDKVERSSSDVRSHVSGGSSGNSGSSSSSSSSGSSGQTYYIGEIVSEERIEVIKGESFIILLSGYEHTIELEDSSPQKVKLSISALPDAVEIKVGEKSTMELSPDGSQTLNIKVKSVNIVSGKVNLFITP